MCQGIVKQLSSYGLGTLRRSIEVINRGRAGIEIRAQIGVAARAEETGPLASTPSKVCRTDAPVLPGPGRARVGVAAISTCLVFTKPLNSRSPLSFTGYFDALSTFVCSCVAICVSSIACLSRRSSIAAAACTGGVDEQAAAGTLALVICCCKAASWRRISSMSRCDCSSAPGCASLHHSVSGSAAQDSPARRCTQPRNRCVPAQFRVPHHLGQVPRTQSVSEIPTHAKHNDFPVEMPSLEQIRRSHPGPLSPPFQSSQSLHQNPGGRRRDK